MKDLRQFVYTLTSPSGVGVVGLALWLIAARIVILGVAEMMSPCR